MHNLASNDLNPLRQATLDYLPLLLFVVVMVITIVACIGKPCNAYRPQS